MGNKICRTFYINILSTEISIVLYKIESEWQNIYSGYIVNFIYVIIVITWNFIRMTVLIRLLVKYSILWYRNFFRSYILNTLSFLFFPWHTNTHLDTPHAYMYLKTRTQTVEHFCRLFFFLFLKTTSPLHYCRCSSITCMSWYCKPVKNIYYNTFRSI